jgi:hypothetical protein
MEASPRNFRTGAEESATNHNSGYSVFRPRFELNTQADSDAEQHKKEYGDKCLPDSMASHSRHCRQKLEASDAYETA